MERVAIPGYEGVYEIDTNGSVWRVGGIARKGGDRPLKTHLAERGYPTLRLSLGGKTRIHQIHRLLALAFIPNPWGLPHARHLNDDKSDLRLENLEWGTPRQNAQDAIRNGHNPRIEATECIHGHAFAGANLKIEIDRHGNVRRRCNTCASAAKDRWYQRSKVKAAYAGVHLRETDIAA